MDAHGDAHEHPNGKPYLQQQLDMDADRHPD
jgi:hypothetical protein